MVNITKHVTKVPVTTFTNKTMINIELDLDEASTLLWVLSKVGGITSGPRRKIDQILRQLENAGVPSIDWKAFKSCSSIYFTNKQDGT
jgi:hypothetical protein